MFPQAQLLLASLLVKAYGQHYQQPPAGFPVPGYGGYAAPVAATPYQGYAGYAPPPQPYGYGYDMMDRYGNGQLRIEQGDYNNLRTSSYGNQDAYSLYGRMNYAVGDNSFRSMAAASQPGTAPGASAHVVYNAGPVVPPVPSATRASNAGLATIGYGARGATANYDSAYRRHNEYGYKPNGGASAGYGNVPYAGYGYSPIGAALGGHTYGMPSPYGYGAAGYAGSQYDPVAYGGAGGFAAGIEGYRRR